MEIIYIYIFLKTLIDFLSEFSIFLVNYLLYSDPGDRNEMNPNGSGSETLMMSRLIKEDE